MRYVAATECVTLRRRVRWSDWLHDSREIMSGSQEQHRLQADFYIFVESEVGSLENGFVAKIRDVFSFHDTKDICLQFCRVLRSTDVIMLLLQETYG